MQTPPVAHDRERLALWEFAGSLESRGSRGKRAVCMQRDTAISHLGVTAREYVHMYRYRRCIHAAAGSLAEQSTDDPSAAHPLAMYHVYLRTPALLRTGGGGDGGFFVRKTDTCTYVACVRLHA